MSASASSKSVASGTSKKSKGKANPFLMFLLEFKRKNNLDMIEAQRKAGQVWDTMTETQRAPYVKLAGNSTGGSQANSKWSGRSGSSTVTKYTTFGESVDQLEAMEAAKKTERLTMKKDVEQMLMKNSLKDLKNQEVYFMAASYYYKESNGKVFPAEIAIAKFSLARGIVDELHIKIYPGELPVGSARVVTELAVATHGYPIPPTSDDANGDYDDIFAKISKFLGIAVGQKRPEYPPIFVHPCYNGVQTVKLVMDTITVEAKENLIFRIYPLENLLFQMVKMMNQFQPNEDENLQDFARVDDARSYLNNDSFSYMPIGCVFHNDQDRGEHCSLSKVRRCSGAVSVKTLHNSDIIVGKHTPISYEQKVHEDVTSVTSRPSSDDHSVVKMLSRLSVSNTTAASVTESGDETVTSMKNILERARLLNHRPAKID